MHQDACIGPGTKHNGERYRYELAACLLLVEVRC
jgi:hypothetical protein